MLDNIFEILKENNWYKYEVTEDNYEKIIRLYDFPNDYIEFIKHYWGEGYIGKNYLSIWKPEWVGPLNKDYTIQKRLGKNCYGFGTDGGDRCYMFDNKNGNKIIRCELGNLDYEDIEIMANTFYELIEKMNKEKI